MSKPNKYTYFPRSEPAVYSPLEVVVDASFEDAVRRFKKAVQQEGIIATLKEKSQYEKPSVRKRRKAREAVARKILADVRAKMVATGEWDKRKKQKDQKKAEKLAKKLRDQESNVE
jgi:small subunit ribosomal protein S21